ncbi:MAG: hypothetical protein AAF411_10545 [Myxococcota bacterium]
MSDKWIGAACWLSEKPRDAVNVRFHFRSEDRRNDWTLLVNADHAAPYA